MPSKLSGILKFIVYSSIYLAVGAASVAYITLTLLNLPFDARLLFIPFSEVLFIFNLNRITDMKEDKINAPERVLFVEEYIKPVFLLSIVLYAASLTIGYQRNMPTFLIILAEGLIGVSYSLLRIKRIYLVKNIAVSFAWGATVLLAGAYFESFGTALYALFSFFSIAFFINNVIFDIKDIEGDKQYGIQTIPNRYGVIKTVAALSIVNTLLLILFLFAIFWGIFSDKFIVLLFFLLYIYAYLFMEGKLNKRLYYGLFVDGEFIFILLVVLVGMYG